MRIPTPFVSQMVGGSGGNNCFSGALASVLAYRGVIAPTQGAMLYVADIVRDGIADGKGQTGGYTSWAMGFRACAWFSQDAVWIDSWAGVWASIAAGEPVIVLLDNVPLDPRQYPRSAAFNAHHFVLFTGTDGEVNDSLRTYPPVGPGTYTPATLRQAVANLGPVQAMALVPIVSFPTDPEEAQVGNQDGIISVLNEQLLAVREELKLRQGDLADRTEERDLISEKVAELVSTNSALGDQLLAQGVEIRVQHDELGVKETEIQSRGAEIDTLKAEVAEGKAQPRVLVTIGTRSWSLPDS